MSNICRVSDADLIEWLRNDANAVWFTDLMVRLYPEVPAIHHAGIALRIIRALEDFAVEEQQ